jgi:magnesium-transporting ATPase (P-type)
VIYALIGKYYITKAYICYLIGTYLFIIAFETCSFFYFYFKVKKMEDIWDKSSIHKIKKSSSSWVNVQFRTLKVGDLIYLKHGTVAPADILIIDTSDTHFSEQILSSNERRVTGCNKLTIKRAIKNLRNKTGIRNPHECIKYLLPLLEGQMEYEPPSERVVHFSGIFKLNNDPQVSKITHKNMIFCGTQLQTSWMIGIVMFTGQQTKIMQMNLLRWTAFQRFRKETKVGQISKVINWILLLYIGVGIMITLLYVVQISFESVEKETSMLIEEFYVGSKFQRFFKVLMIWHSTLMYVPHLIVLVYEFTGFFFGISIQRTQELEIAEKVEAATLAIASTTQFQGRRSYKKKSTRNKSSETLEPRGSAITQGSSVNTPDPVRTGIGGHRFRRGRGEITGNSGHRGFKSTGLANTSQKRSLKSDVSTDSASAAEMRHIKVINYEALPDLGKVNHVVFDKTDTLTLSTMHVCQIATCTNVYTVEGEAKLKELMDLFTTNADLFEFEEDEEAKRLKENSFYSEKSQEYEKEINGEYVPKVVLEDSIDYLNIHGNMPEYNLGERGDTLREMDTGRDESIEVRSREHSLRSIPHRAPLSHKSSIYIGPLSVLQDNKQTFQLPQTKNLFKEDESFIELNLLEKQFKKHWGLVEQALPRSDESSLDVLINLRNGYSIKVNNEKYLQDKHLVADVRKREEQVEELLSYLYVMHLVEYGPHHHEERYLRPEDEAIFEIIKTLGFDQSKIYKSNDNNYLHSDHGPKKMYAFDIKNIGGLKAQAKIYAMNIFSQKRRRKSMIINGLNETEPFQLIAVGSEKTMKRVLRPARNSKEENLLKMLIAKQKQKGLKVVIIAKKALTEDEVFSYTKEYVKISNSARDQIEDLENLAVQMEHDMDFVGCLGLRDSLHEEAVELAKHLSMSKMRMSIMSGDELENCMTVVQKLQISQIDIQNSSSFYWIRLSTAKGVMQEMRRIFDVLYDTLQSESYATIETILKPDKDPPKLISHTSSRVARMETKEEEFFHKEEETKVEELCADEIAANLKKTLLISGESIEIIMNTENLKRHLLAILPASHSVISYDMRPKHKAFLIDLMRSSGDVILAVGDGFNDIGMLARANIGVQLSNENVPLIFGDIVIPNLKHISSLLYVHGFNLKKNMFYVYTAVVNISTSVMFYPIITSFFFNHTISIRLQLEHLYFLTTFYFIATVFGLVNTSYSKDLLLMLPALYLENRIISENSISIYLISFIWAILESVVAFIPNVLFIGGDLSHEGIRSSPEVMNFFYYVTIMCSVAVKVIILLVRRTWSGVFKVVFTSLLVFGIFFLIILNPSFDDALVSGGLGNSLLVFLFSQIIVQCFINFYSAFVIESFKRFYFHRAAHFLRKLSQEPHPSKDKNERVLKYLQKFIKVADDVYLTIIKQMKRPFKDLNYMDNSLKRIVNIDFHNSNMGLGRIANTIVDSDERKKFLIYMSKTTNQPGLRILLIFLLLMGAAEWTIPLFTQTYKTPLLLGTVVPYFCLAIVILLFIQWLFPKFIHRAIICKYFFLTLGAFIILTFVSAGLNFIPNRVFVSSLILLKRFMSSIHFRVPIAYRYTFNILFELIYFVKYPELV